MSTKSHLTNYKVGVGSYQRDAIRFIKSAEKSLISCVFHDLKVVFLIVKYREFWGEIGVKRCQNWSQIGVRKVPEIWGVTWV